MKHIWTLVGRTDAVGALVDHHEVVGVDHAEYAGDPRGRLTVSQQAMGWAARPLVKVQGVRVPTWGRDDRP